MSVALKEIATGPAFRICAMQTGRDNPVEEFLKEQEAERPEEHAKLMNLIDRVTKHGPPKNKEKCNFFKKERIFELKTGGGLRVFAFYGSERCLIVCSHGFEKQGRKTPKDEKTRAVEALARYEEAVKDGEIRET
jgi:phage-related protein